MGTNAYSVGCMKEKEGNGKVEKGSFEKRWGSFGFRGKKSCKKGQIFTKNR